MAKPPYRNPPAKLPSQNPLARRLRALGKESENRSTAELQKGAVERGNREQERESKEKKRMDMEKKPMRKYAKGGKVGKADGIAKKGKTKAKMVKMAMGGLAGRGAMVRGQMQGGPARATFKKGGSCGMKGK